MFSVADSQWMAQALRLAERGLYSTSPNPRVGSVAVLDGKIVGSGWHQRAGEPHAEIHALREAGESARGATVYVNLEPCVHQGKTPPCSNALISAGVARVVVAVEDANPLVAGKGIAKLRSAGITVECGLMETEARQLNTGFFARMTRGRPWLRSKIAASLDGHTALANGESKWITGTEARQDVQLWRARSCAILTGINTILADDARLNVRGLATSRYPLRVVLDSQLRLPPASKILSDSGVLIYTASKDERKRAEIEVYGATVVILPNRNGQVDLQAALEDLARRGVNEVLVEAGSVLNGALLSAGLVDELLLYVAPQMLGDGARGMAGLGELTRLDQRIELQWTDVRPVGKDMRILARVINPPDRHVGREA